MKGTRVRPSLEQETGVVWADAQILHREGAVVQKARPVRHADGQSKLKPILFRLSFGATECSRHLADGLAKAAQ
jgi:hypothetical protein